MSHNCRVLRLCEAGEGSLCCYWSIAFFVFFAEGVFLSSFRPQMLERQQLLREQCSKKPANPSFIEEADFTRFIVIEKLKFVFCFIPKVSCTTWKRTLYTAKNPGKVLDPETSFLSIWKCEGKEEGLPTSRRLWKSMNLPRLEIVLVAHRQESFLTPNFKFSVIAGRTPINHFVTALDMVRMKNRFLRL